MRVIEGQEVGATARRSAARARALWFTGPRRAVVRDAQVPPPRANEVTVRAIASLISLGTEMRVYRGEVPADQEVRPSTVEGNFAFPIKYGYQSVGRVVEAGSSAQFEVGDLVFARYPHQDLYSISVDQVERPLVTRLPEFDDPETALTLNLLEVALNALLDVPVRIGDVVAVFGLGLVGMFCAQLAQRTATRVIAVEPMPLRRSIASTYGIETVEPAGALDAVRSASRGRGADVTFEASGNPAALQQAIRATGTEGTVVVVSFYGDRQVPLVLSPEFHTGRQRLVSSMARTVNAELRSRWDLPRRTQTALSLLPTLHPERLITHRFPFEQAPEAFALADGRPEEVLAIAITYPRAT